jgi:hypothetical protein
MCYYFNRQFSLGAFSRFINEGIFSSLRSFVPGMRQRRIGLKGFIWLGLHIAANTAMGSLSEILGLWVGGGGLPVKMVSESAFCQFRARFPPQGSFSSLALAVCEVRRNRRWLRSLVERA